MTVRVRVRSGSQNHYKSLTTLAPYEGLHSTGDDFHTRQMESEKRVHHHNHHQQCFHRKVRVFARNHAEQDERKKWLVTSYARSTSYNC